MEPLVPALPSTNEYEETATDNGRTCLCFANTNIQHKQTHTHVRSSTTDLWKVTWGLPVGRSTWTWTTLRQRALIEQLMLPSLHQSCFPGDTNHSMLKIRLLWSSLRIPVCLRVSMCLTLCVCFMGEDTLCDITETEPQTQLVLSLRKIQLDVISLAPWGLSLLTPLNASLYSWKPIFPLQYGCEHSAVASLKWV